LLVVLCGYERHLGHAVALLVEALRHKPGFDSRRLYWNFSLTVPSGRTMALGSNQPVSEMRTRNISWAFKEAGAQGWQP